MTNKQIGTSQLSGQKTDDGEIGEITKFLREWAAGNKSTLDVMFDRAYKQLQKAAHEQYRRTSSRGADRPTELVGLVWERLGRINTVPEFVDSRRFYAYCAQIMRNLLIDRIRQDNKDVVSIEGIIDESVLPDLTSMSPESKVIALEFVERMEKEMPKLYEVYNLKKELGFKDLEISEALGIAISTIQSRFALAKAWLKQQQTNPTPPAS
ncbi:MAG TPA: ECF-type sigma factor [Pyrinomonadaceae bacterium]